MIYSRLSSFIVSLPISWGFGVIVTAFLFFLTPNFAEGLRIGIMFGSYDPVHFGHKIIFRNSMEILSLDKLYVVPYPGQATADGESLLVRHQLLQESLQYISGTILPAISFLQKAESSVSDSHLEDKSDSERFIDFEENILRAVSYEEGWDNNYFQIMGTNYFHDFIQQRGMNFTGADVPRAIVVIKRPGFDQTIPRYLMSALGRKLFVVDFSTPDVQGSALRLDLRNKVKTPYIEPRVRNLIEKNKWYQFGAEAISDI